MKKLMFLLLLLFCFTTTPLYGSDNDTHGNTEMISDFPRSEDSYDDENLDNFFEIFVHRIKEEPFNAVATLIFFIAIVHAMMASFFIKKSHQLAHRYEELKNQGLKDKNSNSIPASLLHFLGEVEVVFGIWAIALAIAIAAFYSWDTFVVYVNTLRYTESLFIIVIMTIASSRPILKFFDILMWRIVRVFGASLDAWWLTILIIPTLCASLITGPAAMTIAAFLLANKFYSLNPNRKLRYVTLALLFVNVSVGGSLTNFASPPILMVAGPWQWSTPFMFFTFGWKAILAILISTFVYYFLVKKDLQSLRPAYEDYLYKQYIQNRFISQKELEENFEQLEKMVDKRVSFSSELDAYSVILKENIKTLAQEKLSPEERSKFNIENAIDEKFDGIKLEEIKRTIPGLLPDELRPKYVDPNWDQRPSKVPTWIIVVHLLFLFWTIVNAHEPVLLLGGLLFYLGFYQVTSFYQNRLDIKPALLVAFFLAALVIHGKLQAWWIAPLLGSLPEFGLNLTSILLTSFNDNAAITYLSTLVPNLSEHLKYAVVSGAVTGGGLTLIANAPNPIGQSILKKYFERGINAGQLFKYALLPTIITAIVFYVLKP